MPAQDFGASAFGSPGTSAAHDDQHADGLVGGLYAVNPAKPMGDIGGLSACLATDRSQRRTALVGLQGQIPLPARALALTMLEAAPVEGVLCPIAHGAAIGMDGLPALFTIYPAPQGDRVWPAGAGLHQQAPWNETDLLGLLLCPVAATLDRLQTIGLTHRAIRAGNLFRTRHGDGVLLGPAWSAPPGCFQTALYEPPYSAMCHRAGRGEGRTADDVYALGVTLIVLALGREPLAGLSDEAIIRRKLELGSFAALTEGARLPAAIADLARGMLAEDPDHRPTPALLADPAAARGRRVAARPPRRAQRSLDIQQMPVWTARNLAYALCNAPEQGLQLLRDGSIDRWLRRSLGDPTSAVRLEEAMRRRGADIDDEQRADSLLLLRTITLLDPLAPLSWRGVTLWPDGIGAFLAATANDPAEQQAACRDIILSEAPLAWAAMQDTRVDAVQTRLESHKQLMWMRQRGWGGGLPRLRYALNPLLPCASPTLSGQLVIRLDDLLGALNRVAQRIDPTRPGSAGPIDAQIGAFLAAHHTQRIDADLLAISEAKDPAQSAMVQLRLLAGVQQRGRLPGQPALAAWLGAQVAPLLSGLQNLTRRSAALARLEMLTQAGDLTAMHEVLDDLEGRAVDGQGAEAARQRVDAIDAALAAIARQGSERAQVARRWAHEMTMSAGFVFLAVMGLAAVLD